MKLIKDENRYMYKMYFEDTVEKVDGLSGALYEGMVG